MKHLPISVLKTLPVYDTETVEQAWNQVRAGFCARVVVLDDDPTGVQTVHDVPVYTSWEAETILDAFRATDRMFFILTNSRGLSREETVKVHREIAERVVRAAKETGQDFVIISRSDSTLRGHYPTETRVLKETLERETGCPIDGEILIPFFREGGRYTLGNVHYVAMGEELVPAAETEFAKDRTFGYTQSDLREYVAEKHSGSVRPEEVVCISLEDLRARRTGKITEQLLAVHAFGKVIVNACDNLDVTVFAKAYVSAVQQGKRFLFRTAAALPKVLGGVMDRPLLTGKEMVELGNRNGGLVIVGSHVQKTTAQLEELKKRPGLRLIELNAGLAAKKDTFAGEVDRVLKEETEAIESGTTAVVYTSRTLLTAGTGNPEDDLRLSMRISDAVVRLVRELRCKPGFIIAKGGITSSRVGTEGLGVRRATVLGQILPGIPVWKTDAGSKFPGMAYVVFPGNVGSETALREAVEKLEEEKGK